MASLRTMNRLALRVARTTPSTSHRALSSSALFAGAGRSTTTPIVSRLFSISSGTLGQGETDVELLSKLQEEIQYEQENENKPGESPEFVTEFKSSGIWKIEQKDGHDEIALVRKFGNEEIRVLFSIADIDANAEPPTEFEEESSTENDAENANTQGRAAVRCSITITKDDGGAMNFDAVTEGSHFTIENVSYYADKKLATEITSEADWARRGLYVGPQFDHLDVGVQESFEKYLEERGIGDSLAMFIPDYAEHREQQEYTKWLQNVHKFVSA